MNAQVLAKAEAVFKKKEPPPEENESELVKNMKRLRALRLARQEKP
jgi:hypothetical protein